MAPKPELAKLLAHYAVLCRDRDPDDPERIAARTAYAHARFEGQVAEFVANFPPVSDARCQRIAAMLKAGADMERLDAATNAEPVATNAPVRANETKGCRHYGMR